MNAQPDQWRKEKENDVDIAYHNKPYTYKGGFPRWVRIEATVFSDDFYQEILDNTKRKFLHKIFPTKQMMFKAVGHDIRRQLKSKLIKHDVLKRLNTMKNHLSVEFKRDPGNEFIRQNLVVVVNIENRLKEYFSGEKKTVIGSYIYNGLKNVAKSNIISNIFGIDILKPARAMTKIYDYLKQMKI